MTDARISALHSVELGVPDVASTAKFFTETWGLTQAAADNGSLYLRGTGPNHHIVALHPRPRPELLRINLATADKSAVDALGGKVKAAGIGAGIDQVGDPAALERPGGGYGFAFKDVEGRNLAVVAEIETHADTADLSDRPRKLSHVVLNSDATDDTIGFFTGVLGFTLVDQTKMLNFLRCNSDHHTIAFANGGGAGLHHVAYELPDIESLMLGVGRMRDSGWNVDWGVGRHGPGNNVFSYFVGPDDMVIEYTAEVMQVDETYQPGGPDDWGFLPGRTDQWGVTDPPSDRLKAVHGKVGFADSLDIPA
jgi:catechol 2,3-dioxygenase